MTTKGLDGGAVSAEERGQILDLLGQYFFALDTGAADDAVALFTEDGVVVYAGGERFEGREALRAWAARTVGGPRSRGRMHLNFPLFFKRVDGAVVACCYNVGAHWAAATDNKSLGAFSYTEDRVVMTPTGWRIAERSIARWNDATVPWVGP